MIQKFKIFFCVLALLLFLNNAAEAVPCTCSGDVSGPCPGSNVTYSESGEADDCTVFCDEKRAEAEATARGMCICCKCRNSDGSIREVPADKAPNAASCQSECEAATGGTSYLFVEALCSSVTTEVPAFSPKPPPSSSSGSSVELPTGPPPPRVNLENPLGGSTGEVSVPKIIGNIIKTILTLVGALALGMFVYGGFTWLTSGGSSEKIQKGKNILMWATIGLVVIFASYTLVDFLLRAFGA